MSIYPRMAEPYVTVHIVGQITAIPLTIHSVTSICPEPVDGRLAHSRAKWVGWLPRSWWFVGDPTSLARDIM